MTLGVPMRDSRTWSAELGTAVHELLAQVARPGAAPIGAAELLQIAGRHPTPRKAVGSRVAMNRNRIAFSLAVYLRHFLLPAGWQLLASGVRTEICELDLVWAHRDGRVIVDEVKTGAVDKPVPAELEAQIGRQLVGAADLYGEAFIGVRVLLLRAPGDARFFTTTGDIEHLEDRSWQ